MNTHKPSRALAQEMADRSHCAVQVGAVVEDAHGIFSWGWNHEGSNGRGCHAEVHAILRANKRRLRNAKITVFGKYRRNNNPVVSKPCDNCAAILKFFGVLETEYYARNHWRQEVYQSQGAPR